MKLFHIVLLSLALANSAQAATGTAAEAQRLLASGQPGPAQVLLESALKTTPRDPELRFLLGIVMTDLARTPEALQIFIELSQEFPELPDPLNNLAVLHASRGDLDAARAALEAALRKNPQHRAARENLGDVYLRLAVRQWQSAADLAPAEPSLTQKLSLVRSVIQKLAPARSGPPARP